MTIRERLERSGALVKLQDLPTTVHGFCYHDDEQNPYIIINARMDYAHQRKTLLHELEHIENEEMYNQSFIEYGGVG